MKIQIEKNKEAYWKSECMICQKLLGSGFVVKWSSDDGMIYNPHLKIHALCSEEYFKAKVNEAEKSYDDFKIGLDYVKRWINNNMDKLVAEAL